MDRRFRFRFPDAAVLKFANVACAPRLPFRLANIKQFCSMLDHAAEPGRPLRAATGSSKTVVSMVPRTPQILAAANLTREHRSASHWRRQATSAKTLPASFLRSPRPRKSCRRCSSLWWHVRACIDACFSVAAAWTALRQYRAAMHRLYLRLRVSRSTIPESSDVVYYKCKGRVLGIALLHDEHLHRSALRSQKWRLSGMS